MLPTIPELKPISSLLQDCGALKSTLHAKLMRINTAYRLTAKKRFPKVDQSLLDTIKSDRKIIDMQLSRIKHLIDILNKKKQDITDDEVSTFRGYYRTYRDEYMNLKD